MGVLVDHLLPWTKEWRVVEVARRLRPWADHVLVVGHPYIDVWDLARARRRVLGAVDGYADLEPELLGRVDELVDFVTAPG